MAKSKTNAPSFIGKIKDWFYGVSVALHEKFGKNKKTGKISSKKRNKAVFYYAMMFLPLLQFAIFYIYVNFNSVLMSFQFYDYSDGAFKWTGLSVFKEVFSDLGNVTFLKKSVGNSLVSFLFHLLVGIPVPLVFSYYLYKKYVGHAAFKIILFLPSMISSVVLVVLFKYFTEYALPVMGKAFGLNIPITLLYDANTAFGVVLFYSIWVGLGTQIILYSGAMSGIDPSITESASLDGANPFKEFIFIVIPMIWNTLVTFVVVKFADIFVNQMNLFDFYGTDASDSIMTIGYYLYKRIQSSTSTVADYPYLSAMGMVFTLITIPVTFGVKRLLEKFGPSEV